MKNIQNYLKVAPTPLKLSEGRLLASVPLYNDPSFNRSVVLLIEYSKNATVGLIINHPLKHTVREITSDIKIDDPIYYGGPVLNQNIFAIHNFENSKYSEQVAPNIFVGYDNIFLSLIEHKAIPYLKYKFFVGYSGWSSGQLEEELNNKMWIVCPANEELIFNTPADKIWDNTIQSLGNDYLHWLQFPEYLTDN